MSMSKLVAPPVLMFLMILNLVAAPLQSEASENTEAAIERIRRGPHASMPPPREAHATGGPGKGMSIENQTGFTLHVHFHGPVSTSIEVPAGESVDVALTVGTYEVAVEIRNATVVPFYGVQKYRPRSHYWLKFFLKTRVVPKKGPTI